jgi:F0F1-type ATP synthase assembly protein I
MSTDRRADRHAMSTGRRVVPSTRRSEAQAERQALWNGFGNGLSQAFELAAVPALFALLGWWLDSLAGTGPGLLIGFMVLGLTGTVARAYYAYTAEMAEHEKDKPWTRSRP